MGLLKLMQPCRAVAAAAMAMVLLQTPTGGSSPVGTSVGTLAFLPSGGASCSECASSQRVLNSRQAGSWWSRPVRLAKVRTWELSVLTCVVWPADGFICI